MTDRVPINPELIVWARQRAGLEPGDLQRKFRYYNEWETGQRQPTLKQLESFAQTVHVAIGLLFLPKPPIEPLPIPDLRTVADQALTQPSTNLMDTLYLCQQRQAWFREYAQLHAEPPLAFIGSVTTEQAIAEVAEQMRATLALSIADRQQAANWGDALRQLIQQCEAAGILVMASSIVGSNSQRKLDVAEFRGFVLADTLAPLIFLNASDSKSAQMFTLAHELAHLWLGESGLSDSESGRLPDLALERWCNAVAAEFLLPLEQIRVNYQPQAAIPDELQRLAKRFKVSTLVVLRRLFDAGFFDQATLWQHYRQEQQRLAKLDRSDNGGGDFYRTLATRTGKRFATAVVSSTLEGQTLFQEAYRLLGVRKNQTFYQTARELGVSV